MFSNKRRFRSCFVPATVVVIILSSTALTYVTQCVTVSQNCYMVLACVSSLLLYGFALFDGAAVRPLFGLGFLFVGAAPRFAAHIVNLINISAVQTVALILAHAPILGIIWWVNSGKYPFSSRCKSVLLASAMGLVWAEQAIVVPSLLNEPLLDNRVASADVLDGGIAVSNSGGGRLVYSISNNWCDVRFMNESPSKKIFAGDMSCLLLGIAVSDQEAVAATGTSQEGGTMEIKFSRWNAAGETSLGSITRPKLELPSNATNMLSPTGNIAAFNGGQIVHMDALSSGSQNLSEVLAETRFVGWSTDAKFLTYYSASQNSVILIHVETRAMNSYFLKYSPSTSASIRVSPSAKLICYVVGKLDTLVFEDLSSGKVGTVRLGGALKMRADTPLLWVNDHAVVYITHRGGLFKILPRIGDRAFNSTRVSQILDVVVGASFANEKRTLYWTTTTGYGTDVHALILGEE